MNSILAIVAFIWGVRIILNTLSYIHLWYIKEYRFDRMLIHLKSPQGKKILFPPWRRPPITPKTVVVFFGALFCLSLLFVSLPVFVVWKFAVTDILTLPVLTLLVIATKIPTFIYHRILIQRAVAKLRAHKKMVVIGITGSYGKTSTKEILATLLSLKYKTLATRASKNSPIAIAELIVHNLRHDTEMFIVEMGAYKKGEIAQMCAMVHPRIGIVTAINAQHQDLFGSIENTVEAKYELLAGLTGRKIAIVNRDDPLVANMGKRAAREGCRVIEYSAKGIEVSQSDNGLRFSGISVRLFGRHQVSNILAAMKAAEEVGETRAEIIKACRSIRPLLHTMNPVRGINGSTFIDDTFNNNPDAAMAALEYLDTKAGRKIVVFQPMIELGKFALGSHERVAKKMKSTASEIILTNDSFAEVFGGSSIVLSPKAAANRLNKIVKPGDSVLFKGKEAGRVLQLLV